MSEIPLSKQTFLHNEIWLLTFGGAFQHVKIYKPNIKEKDKTTFRIALKNFVTEHIIPQYKEPVVEFSHILNLEGIVVFSEDWHEILNNGKLLIGVSQKLLNLALKYYWCLGEIAEPPHCPVDRIIQQKGLKSKNLVNWTTMAHIEEYLQIMHKIKLAAEEKGQSIAEWELEVF
jgi:hypothetical protein